jgi:hypothetical protein
LPLAKGCISIWFSNVDGIGETTHYYRAKSGKTLIWITQYLSYANLVIFFYKKNQTKVDWQFFIADANIKLKQLYPSILD